MRTRVTLEDVMTPQREGGSRSFSEINGSRLADVPMEMLIYLLKDARGEAVLGGASRIAAPEAERMEGDGDFI